MPNPKSSSSQSPSQIAGAAIRTFFNITNAWKLSTEEQRILLGNPSRSAFFNWKKHAPTHLSDDTLERISYILGIYKSLQILLPTAEAADAWIKKPNHASLFGGQSALDRMLKGHVADLYVVRQYLDAQRGG